jgi:hypothetical protein
MTAFQLIGTSDFGKDIQHDQHQKVHQRPAAEPTYAPLPEVRTCSASAHRHLPGVRRGARPSDSSLKLPLRPAPL